MHLALDRAEIKYNTVYYAEIDKYANQVTAHHFPQDIPLGDVTKWREWNIDWSSIGLVGAGFPCQAWSVAGKQLGDKDERGMLFWTTLEIIAHVLKNNPKAKFLMENVKMKKDFEEYITHHTTEALGYVEKTLINSALVSAQNRNRYYWTNFKIEQPQDKGILLRDVLEHPMNEKYNLSSEAIARFKPCKKTSTGQIGTTAHEGKIGQRDRVYDADGKMITLTATIYKQPPQYAVTGGALRGRYNHDGTTSQQLEVNDTGRTNALTTVQKDNVAVFNNETATSSGKAYTLTASYGGAVAWNSAQKKQRTMVPVEQRSDDNPNTYNGLYYRKLTPTECARLQTFPDGWAESIVSNTQAYKAYGNAWTVDVIAHILKFI